MSPGESELVPYRLWSFDEDFGLAQLVLVLVHIDRVEEVQDPLALLPSPVRPSLPRQNGVPERDGPP